MIKMATESPKMISSTEEKNNMHFESSEEMVTQTGVLKLNYQGSLLEMSMWKRARLNTGERCLVGTDNTAMKPDAIRALGNRLTQIADQMDRASNNGFIKITYQ